MTSSINERIRKYRTQKKLNQTQLGKLLGMKCSTYSQMERQGNISVDMALKIAEALGVDPDLIIFDNPPSEKLNITPIKPQILIAKEPSSFIENYAKEDLKISKEEKEGILNGTEKSIIEIYRNLPKAKQKEFRAYIDSLRKGD